MDTSRIRFKTLQSIKKKHLQKDVFRTAQIREDLGFEANSSEARHMNALVTQLKKSGTVEAIGDRGRHQNLRVIDPDDLSRRIERTLKKLGGTPTTNGSPNRTPKRVVELEDRVAALEELREEIKLMRVEQASMSSRMDELIELWA